MVAAEPQERVAVQGVPEDHDAEGGEDAGDLWPLKDAHDISRRRSDQIVDPNRPRTRLSLAQRGGQVPEEGERERRATQSL